MSMEAKLTSSNGDIPYLPLHIVEEILYRLDVQTLSQSSLFVCRDWNKLVTSPDFMFGSSSFGSRNQILLIKACYYSVQNYKLVTSPDFMFRSSSFGSRNQILFIKACYCSAQNYERDYIHFPYCRVTYLLHWHNNQFDLSPEIENNIDDFEDTEVIGVSNGLICLASSMPFKFILWNPSVRKYAWLPLMMNWDLRLSIVGFGFDYSNNDFKIVNIITYPSLSYWFKKFHSVWVFSYITWSWKHLTHENILHSCYIYRGKPNIYLNGIIHWVAHSNEINHDIILTFDLSREIFGQILLPKDAHHFSLNFVATTGDLLLFTQEELEYVYDDDGFSLEYVYDDDGFSHCRVDTWAMKQYGNHESWTKTSSLKMKIKMGPEHVLGARKNGDLILEMEEGQTYRYNRASPSDVLLMGTMENNVFFRYHTQSLYLLEKDDGVISY